MYHRNHGTAAVVTFDVCCGLPPTHGSNTVILRRRKEAESEAPGSSHSKTVKGQIPVLSRQVPTDTELVASPEARATF